MWVFIIKILCICCVGLVVYVILDEKSCEIFLINMKLKLILSRVIKMFID